MMQDTRDIAWVIDRGEVLQEYRGAGLFKLCGNDGGVAWDSKTKSHSASTSVSCV